MKERIKINGKVTVRVFDEHGNVRRHKTNLFDWIFGGKGKEMKSVHHNIVTRQGDALIIDALMGTQARTKITTATGYIQVGSGWSGSNTKNNTKCNTAAGSAQKLDNGYPSLKAAWGATGDNIIVYRATFDVGALNVNGINEACLLNGNGSNADCFAYAQITPAVNITSNDTLQVLWEITITGQ